ncbi:uncharacterized protein LOC141754113 [Sebastes fasciatus]|uniref:uncharacterized protein LOC141754113 n=1 Tax=Sebastes fasciatus TaxID=394691 RepID=UPI003D9EBC5C
MCKVQKLRALVKQRLTAAAEEICGLFERTIAEYEEELSRSKEENERQQKLLDAVLHPQLRTDVDKVTVSKEEVPSEQQEWSSSLDQKDPEPPHIKEEQEDLWTSQEGEQLQGLEEADIVKFPFSPVPVKSEEDEEKSQSSQLHQRQTEQMETEADGEDCGGPEPDTDDKTGDSCEPDTNAHDDDLKGQSSLNTLKNNGCNTDKKSFRCSECGKRFSQNSNLKIHMRIHSGEKPFSCSVCGKRFIQKIHMTHHMAVHTGEKLFSCSVCNKRFAWRRQIKKHKCVGHQSSQLHQSQTEENREAEPPASSSIEKMETEADGDDCGGPEPARNSDPYTHPEPDTVDKTGDSSEAETDDSDDWKETREPQSGLSSPNNDEVPVSDDRCSAGEKRFSCSECDKRFGLRGNLNRHMRTHTGEKPFSCSVCKKSFARRGDLLLHMRIHTGEKPFSCSLCTKSFRRSGCLQTHMRIHTGEKPFNCSVCDKRFLRKTHLKRHIKTHTGEKPFNCSVCDKRFTIRANMTYHMAVHRGEKRYSCSICDKTFAWYRQVKTHQCHQSSQTHQSQTEENREAEPPASSSTEQIKTEADGEDCGGPEPAMNSDPDRHPEPDTDDKTSHCSAPKSEVPVNDIGLNNGKKP